MDTVEIQHKPVLTMPIAVAAELMEVSRRHARRLLIARNRERPELGLLQRPSGSPAGRIEVNVRAFRVLRLGGGLTELDELASRVGLLESDVQTLRVRVSRNEIDTLRPKKY